MKKHYSGDLGTFTYDNKEFSIVKAPEGVSQDYILQYIGLERDAKKITIPYGLVNATRLFAQNYAITSVPDIPDTVKDCTEMFYNCIKLQSIDIVLHNTITYCTGMFSKCTSLEKAKVVIPSKDKVDVNCMFKECFNLTECTLDISTTNEFTNAASLFCDCSSLKEVNVIWPNKVKTLCNIFSGCESLIEVADLPETKDLTDGFAHCTSLKHIPNIKNIENLTRTFQDCNSLKTVDIETSAIDYTCCFYNCRNLESVKLRIQARPETYEFKHCFNFCVGLKTVDIEMLDFSISNLMISSYDCMFYNCQNLTKINIPFPRYIKSAKNMYEGCGLRNVPKISDDTYLRIDTMKGMFDKCKLLSLPLSFALIKKWSEATFYYDEVLDLHDVYFYADKTVSCNWYKIYQRFKLKEPPILNLTTMNNSFAASCKDNYSVEANFYSLCKTQ